MADKRYHIIVKKDRENFIKKFNRFLDNNHSGYLLILSVGDTFKGGRKGEKYVRDMADKLADILDMNEQAVLATPKKLFQFPNRMAGVMLNINRLSTLPYRLDSSLKYNYEADYLLKIIRYAPFLVAQDIEYIQGEPGDGNYREFEGIYDKAWYLDHMDGFLLPLLKDMNEEREENPLSFLIQFYGMYSIACRLDANQNNNNRHVLGPEQTVKFREKIGEALQYIDDDIIMNTYLHPVYKRDYQYSRMLLRFKYAWQNSGEYETEEAEDDFLSYKRETDEENDHPELMIYSGDARIYNSDRLSCNIQFMDYKDGMLEIDGSLPDIYDARKVRYYFEIDGERYDIQLCDRYSLTKYFGVAAYKRYPFHASVSLNKHFRDKKKHIIRFFMEYEKEAYEIKYEFKSHTSRLEAYPSGTYWHFGNYLAVTEHFHNEKDEIIVTGIVVKKYNWLSMAGKELKIWWQLLISFQMHRFRFLLLRMAWVFTRPYYKNKNIWMFFDKIYKGGDSAEYMYKYAYQRMKDKSDTDRMKDKSDSSDKKAKKRSKRISPDRLYYLIDRNATDYARLRSEGYKPLKRGSFKHRLIFLNADMMLVTNSTVFAFNDYYLENSRYVRGIVDFHTVCLQHGLSVQKIALAQQRLRDNTRLYYCASKYEIENLSHPVYDYVGYNALRLTGIPRYDGLINDDKKQIMISPTWRMQSAKFVSKNEGVERDYNPLFKETSYFKVYNGLINDKDLIAAAQEYGYRIAYVLHPIVSPQADDFDKNDYVDIIPAVGDMSYEKMFCESSLMVTDYSGIQFDFAYMRKPLVYYHPQELEAHYEEGTFHYDTMAFGEIVRRKQELVGLLVDYMKNGCEMKEIYRMRADDFFEYDDRNNCIRVYEDIIKYQESRRVKKKKGKQ